MVGVAYAKEPPGVVSPALDASGILHLTTHSTFTRVNVEVEEGRKIAPLITGKNSPTT